VTGRLVLPPFWTPRTVEVTFGLPSTHQRSRRTAVARREKGYAFAFPGVRPGIYRLAASLDGRKPNATVTVAVDQADVERNLKLEPPVWEGYTLLRVVGPDGEDAGELTTAIDFAGPDGQGGMAGGTRPLGGGLYMLRIRRHVPETYETYDRYRLRIDAKRYGVLSIPFDPRSEKTTTVQFEEPATVSVVLPGIDTSPHAPFLRIHMRRAGSGDRTRPWRYAKMSPQGVLEVPGVQPGEIELILGVRSDRLFCAIAVQTVSIRPGPNRIELTIPTLHTLRLTRTRAEIENVGVRGPLESRRFARFKNDETTLERLLPGTYELTGFSDGEAWTKQVRVPEQTAVRVP
ncbi:MAG: hypothetical protein AAGD14_16570, partial [Planctomycetota bacterium]